MIPTHTNVHPTIPTNNIKTPPKNDHGCSNNPKYIIHPNEISNCSVKGNTFTKIGSNAWNLLIKIPVTQAVQTFQFRVDNSKKTDLSGLFLGLIGSNYTSNDYWDAGSTAFKGGSPRNIYNTNLTQKGYPSNGITYTFIVNQNKDTLTILRNGHDYALNSRRPSSFLRGASGLAMGIFMYYTGNKVTVIKPNGISQGTHQTEPVGHIIDPKEKGNVVVHGGTFTRVGNKGWNCLVKLPVKTSMKIAIKVDKTHTDMSGLFLGLVGINNKSKDVWKSASTAFVNGGCSKCSAVLKLSPNGYPLISSTYEFDIDLSRDSIFIYRNGNYYGTNLRKPSSFTKPLFLGIFMYYPGNKVTVTKMKQKKSFKVTKSKQTMNKQNKKVTERNYYMNKYTRNGNDCHTLLEPQPTSKFTQACCSGDLKIVQNFLTSNNFSIQQNDHKYALHYSAFHRHFEIVKELIDSDKYDIDMRLRGIPAKRYCNDKVMRLSINVFDVLRKSLMNIVGLNNIKEYIYTLANKIILDRKRQKMGFKISKQTYDMCLVGNPGVGKTLIARTIAKLYKTLKITTKDTVVEVQREALVAGYIGQTASKTEAVIQKAKGGVLFVDEAYRLCAGDGKKDFGPEAIEQIMKHMNSTDIIFMFAGYVNEMKEFIATNPGLFRRLAYTMEFKDFTPLDLAKIVSIKVNNSEYVFEKGVTTQAIAELIEKFSYPKLRSTMNGGMSQRLFMYACNVLNESLSLDSEGSDLITLKLKHFEIAMKKYFYGKKL